MTQGERVRVIRKELGLTLEKFGEPLNVKKGAISAIETNRNSLTAKMFNDICREYRVNPDYLSGKDEDEKHKFIEVPQTVIDELCEQHNCDSLDRSIIKEYLELNEDDRKVIKEYIRKIATRVASEDKVTIAPQTPSEMERIYDPVEEARKAE